MAQTPFLTRVILKNYKSIGYCDVPLQSLTYLVGPNGSGKSNFLDALHLVQEALSGTLENALHERGGLSEVRRRSSGHPNNFSILLHFKLPNQGTGTYGFRIGATTGGGFIVQEEECTLEGGVRPCFFKIERGKLKRSSETSFPAISTDRLALVSISGQPQFRPIYDALQTMGFYNLNPRIMRELQKPQDGRLLKPAGENIASVVGHLERSKPDGLRIIEEYLHHVVASVDSLRRIPVGPMETLEFRQQMAGAKYPWSFYAQSMSDGTLRAVGVLTALFQGSGEKGLSLVGIEEPETALHPAASAALREALTSASSLTQVVVTSHSPELLDDPGIEPDSILSVEYSEGETRIAPIDQAARASIHAKLYTAGELLRLNQLAPSAQWVEEQKKAQTELFDEADDQ